MADTLAAIYLSSASMTAGSVEEGAASRKDNKYSAIAQSHVFIPLAIETLGPINFKGLKFLSELVITQLLPPMTPEKHHSCSSEYQPLYSVLTLSDFRALSPNMRKSNFSRSRNCF